MLKYWKKLESRRDDFIHEQISIGKLEKFGKRFWVSKLDSFSECEEIEERIEKKSNFGMKLLNLLNWLYLIKFAAPLFTNNKFIVRTLFADIGWLMVKIPKPSITVCHTSCVVFVMSINIYWQYTEYKNNNGLIRFLAKLKDNKLEDDVKLSDGRLVKRFRMRSCMFIMYSLKVLHKMCTTVLTTSFSLLTLMGYFRPNSGFHWLSTAFWLPITLVWVTNYFAVLIYVFAILFTSILYLKYKYIEINNVFDYCLKTGDTRPLLANIRSHNSVSLWVKDITGSGNVLMFVLYYLGSPSLETLLYNWHDPNSTLIWRTNVSIIFNAMVLSIGSAVFFMSSFSHNAHKPYDQLYKILIKTELTRKQRLKINEFMEHLCGPKIGFYCLDLFPMNSFKFFEYLMFCSCFYIMILQYLQ